MRVLVVVHNFLPDHHAGAEMYTYRLAQQLRESVEVDIFTVNHALFRRNYSMRNYEIDGLNVFSVTNHRKHKNYSETYSDPTMEARFRTVLNNTRPDIVHFQHLLHHSVRYPQIARDRGIPSVMTFHEYWTMCGRNGQLIQEDDTRCSTARLDKCAKCLSTFMWGRGAVDVWALRGVSALKGVTRVDLKARARDIRLKRRRPSDHGSRKSEDLGEALLFREAAMRDLFDSIDCFVAPSKFLKARLVEYGLETDRVLYSDYGTPVDDFMSEPHKESDGPLRIGFLGSMQQVKGVHVLMAALKLLEKGTFSADFYGNISIKPEYVRDLSGPSGEAVRVMGEAPAKDIPLILSGFDVLVVPSIWWENSPLVIHEAFAAGVPVICSNIGGMAELVVHGVSGILFETGSSEALASALQGLIADRQLLTPLRAGIPQIKTMEADAGFHLELFQSVLAVYAED